MPSLKQLTCTIEKGIDNVPLTEYGKKYADGLVTSYIRVPSQSTAFSIHLTSSGYIAPGLAMFVFIDGVPQCNRNRRGLVIPDETTAATETEVEFRVRQKEDKFDERRFIGREWTFEGLNTTQADRIRGVDKDVLKSVGTIEVVVLRCHGNVRAIANDKRPVVRGTHDDGVVDLGGQLDGAGDSPQHTPTLSIIGGFDGAYDNPWPPSPSVPERYKHLDGRKKGRKSGGGDPLAGLGRAFQQQGISGYAPPNVDGASSQYPVHPPSWPAYHQSPGNYQYPRPWVYPPYYGQPPPGYGGPPDTRQAGAGAREWKPMWAEPAKEGSQAAGDAANDWDDDVRSNVKATSMVSAAQDDGGKQDQNNGWDASNNDQEGSGDNAWNQETGGNDWNQQVAGETWDTNGNDQPANDGWNLEDQQNQANNTNNDSNDWNTGSSSKDHATKSRSPRKQKTRRPTRQSHHSHDGASDHSTSKAHGTGHIKSYWSNWAQPSNFSADAPSGSITNPGNRDPYVVPAEPLQPVPQSLAAKGDLTHQVRAGRGKLYYHSTGTPRYIDTMSAPYAVFVFKYRSQEALERILPGVKIKTDVLPLEARWKKMNEEERLAYMLKLQARIGSSDESSTGDDEGTHSDSSMVTTTTRKTIRSAMSARTAKSSRKTKKEKKKEHRNDKKGGNSGGHAGEDWSGGGGNNNAGEDWSGGSGGNANNQWGDKKYNGNGNTGWDNNNEFNAGGNEWDQPAAGGGEGW